MTYLPHSKPPKLPIAPYMRHDQNMQIVSRIRDGSNESGNDGAEDEELRDRRVGKARCNHC